MLAGGKYSRLDVLFSLGILKTLLFYLSLTCLNFFGEAFGYSVYFWCPQIFWMSYVVIHCSKCLINSFYQKLPPPFFFLGELCFFPSKFPAFSLGRSYEAHLEFVFLSFPLLLCIFLSFHSAILRCLWLYISVLLLTFKLCYILNL